MGANTIITMLLCCQQLSSAWTTRLPLEVYELQAAATAATTAVDDNNNGNTNNYTWHRNLAYATVNANILPPATAATMANHHSGKAVMATDLHYVTTGAPCQHLQIHEQAQQQQQQQHQEYNADHRRSRQMLEIIEQQHRYHQDTLQQQQQQQQQHQQKQPQKLSSSAYEQNIHSYNRQRHGGGHSYPDIRILYQIGNSEDDLPICAPNAVCSKIDLYETPWIERQCRCPEVNRQPHIILHHHSHQRSSSTELSHSTHEKLRNYYEKEKLLQHKRLFIGDFNDKKFESLHLKKLMQRLGAVYEEDLHLQTNDYVLPSSHSEDNDALPNSHEDDQMGEFSDNEFSRTLSRHNYYSVEPSTAHMRHSGHNGHRAKDTIILIGGCPSGLGVEDGHTVADKTRHYKMCQPIYKLPICKHFHDHTWTLTTSAELNVTEQIVHCRCPKNSVTYLTKREPTVDGASGYTYLFACSPITRIRCQRKQPCKLFTVRKRQEFLDEVNINALCQCPKGHRCPSHHTQSSVIAGESFLEDNIQTYSGYCMAND